MRTAGYVGPVAVVTNGKKALEVTLLYAADGAPQMRGVRRVSTPGRRWYVRRQEIPRVLSGGGTAILSTSRGLLTDAEARKRGIGGEVLCTIW
jgi:small subunit ribosomal protein S8